MQAAEDKKKNSENNEATPLFLSSNLGQVKLMINLFGSRPNLCYDEVVKTLSTINNTSLLKSPSESV